jgi:hypothetical protein
VLALEVFSGWAALVLCFEVGGDRESRCGSGRDWTGPGHPDGLEAWRAASSIATLPFIVNVRNRRVMGEGVHSGPRRRGRSSWNDRTEAELGVACAMRDNAPAMDELMRIFPDWGAVRPLLSAAAAGCTSGLRGRPERSVGPGAWSRCDAQGKFARDRKADGDADLIALAGGAPAPIGRGCSASVVPPVRWVERRAEFVGIPGWHWALSNDTGRAPTGRRRHTLDRGPLPDHALSAPWTVPLAVLAGRVKEVP